MTMNTYGIGGRKHVAEVLKLGKELIGQEIVVGGWIKTGRTAEKKTLFFYEVNDGSSPGNIQCKKKVAEGDDVTQWVAMTKTGACVLLRCNVVEAPEKAKQDIEFDIVDVIEFGAVGEKYAIAKSKLSLEFLRSPAAIHLRARSNTISAVARVRNALAQATHQFFSSNGFLYLHTPLITSSDCEGAGEMFQITTLLSKAEALERKGRPTEEDYAEAKAAIDAQGAVVSGLKKKMKEAEKNQKKTQKKADDAKAAGNDEEVEKLTAILEKLAVEGGSKKEALQAEIDKLLALKEDLKEFELRKTARGGIPYKEDGTIDYGQDFFGKVANLTVSGQLQGEAYACGMSNIYTFGPTFRAEESYTSRHLAEFWMIEPEIAFCDINGLMQCAEDYVRFCAQFILDNCYADLEFFTKHFDKTAMDRVKLVASEEVVRLEYKKAVEILIQHNDKFETPVTDRIDLASEHERYLTEQIYKKPVIVYNYPREIKAFYMRQNDDDYDSVAAMDMLVPGVGELVGGSQREERAEVLEKRITDLGLDLDDYQWYLDLRRHGTCTHSGFGLGFERLILFITGMENIRDVIPFPRWPQHIL